MCLGDLIFLNITTSAFRIWIGMASIRKSTANFREILIKHLININNSFQKEVWRKLPQADEGCKNFSMLFLFFFPCAQSSISVQNGSHRIICNLTNKYTIEIKSLPFLSILHWSFIPEIIDSMKNTRTKTCHSYHRNPESWIPFPLCIISKGILKEI